MNTRLLAALLAVVLLFALIPAAYASEEAEEPAEEITAEVPEETPVPAEESEQPEETAPAEEPVQEDETVQDDAAVQNEDMVQEEEVPVDDDPFPDADHEDPMYWEMLERYYDGTLDGVSSSYSSFIPRSLNNETLYYGIDVSNWQGDINWSAVAASGVQFVIIRAAYRSVGAGSLYLDSRFYSYVSGAKAAGLLVGAYIYSQAITVQEGIDEANYLVKLCSGLSMDLPLVLDYEYYGTSGRLYNAHLSRQTATDICNAFCDTVEAAGYESMVYGNPSMLNSSLYREQLGRVWLAHFTKQTSYAGSYEYWQPGVGYISGISGTTDLDFWFRPNDTVSSPQTTEPPAATEQPVQTEEPEQTEKPEQTETPVQTDTPVAVGDTPFTDIADDDWFYDTIVSAYKQGIVNGLSETMFGPNAVTTRGQTITMIYRLVGSPETDYETVFADLVEKYYQSAVAWGVENGIVKGKTDTTFAPNANITRQDLAVLLYRLAGEPEQEGDLSAFTDSAEVSDYAQQAMLWAVNTGIVTGFDDGTLGPKSNATRAQICTMLMRFQELVWNA